MVELAARKAGRGASSSGGWAQPVPELGAVARAQPAAPMDLRHTCGAIVLVNRPRVCRSCARTAPERACTRRALGDGKCLAAIVKRYYSALPIDREQHPAAHAVVA